MCDYRPAKAAIWWQKVQRSILNCLRAGWLRLGKEIHMGWQSERIGTMHRRCKDDMEHALMLFKLKCWGAQVWWHGIMIFDFFLLPDDPKESLRVFHEMVCNAVQYPCPRRLDDPQYTHDYASVVDGQRADATRRESVLLIDHGSKAWPAYGMWGKQIVSRHLFKQLVSSRIMLNAIIMMVTLVSASTHCGLGGWRRAFSRRWWIHMMFFSNSLV